jgi:hypothetical protein
MAPTLKVVSIVIISKVVISKAIKSIVVVYISDLNASGLKL